MKAYSYNLLGMAMLKKPSHFIVWQFLYCMLENQIAYIEKHPEYNTLTNRMLIEIPFSKISRLCHIARGEVPQILSNLDKMKLITRWGKTRYHLHTERFMQLIKCFSKLDESQWSKFTDALYSGDEQLLIQFGMPEQKRRKVYAKRKG